MVFTKFILENLCILIVSLFTAILYAGLSEGKQRTSHIRRNFMTSNQLAYANYVENSRHNRVGEGQNLLSIGNEYYLRDYANQTSRGTLGETIRHNQVGENQNLLSLDRTYEIAQRNATSTERNATTTEGNLTESNRHNKVSEKLGYDDLSARIGMNAANNLTSIFDRVLSKNSMVS